MSGVEKRATAQTLTRRDLTRKNTWGNVYAGLGITILILFGVAYAAESRLGDKAYSVASSLMSSIFGKKQ